MQAILVPKKTTSRDRCSSARGGAKHDRPTLRGRLKLLTPRCRTDSIAIVREGYRAQVQLKATRHSGGAIRRDTALSAKDRTGLINCLHSDT